MTLSSSLIHPRPLFNRLLSGVRVDETFLSPFKKQRTLDMRLTAKFKIYFRQSSSREKRIPCSPHTTRRNVVQQSHNFPFFLGSLRRKEGKKKYFLCLCIGSVDVCWSPTLCTKPQRSFSASHSSVLRISLHRPDVHLLSGVLAFFLLYRKSLLCKVGFQYRTGEEECTSRLRENGRLR